MRRLARRIFFLCIFTLLVWAAGLIWFLFQIPTKAAPSAEPSDAIVVLTGGSGRIDSGLRLLAEKKGKKLFISGAGSSTTPADVIRNAPADIRGQLAYRTVDITLGHYAQNTIGNAEETALWLGQQQYSTIRVVTSNYHIPRALEELRQTAPGVKLIPEPVFAEEFTVGKLFFNTESRQIVMSEYHKYLAGKLRHIIVANSQE